MAHWRERAQALRLEATSHILGVHESTSRSEKRLGHEKHAKARSMELRADALERRLAGQAKVGAGRPRLQGRVRR